MRKHLANLRLPMMALILNRLTQKKNAHNCGGKVKWI
jgi:hypothetical protein